MIPARDPTERADQYLDRLNVYERDRLMAIKEARRAERRIRSEVERILIERAVKEALRPVKTGYTIRPRANRWYRIPDRPWILGPFTPLYILISVIWQNVSRTDNRYDRGISISRADPGGDNEE